jgi:single-stranded-DNA-specific exonuclease
MKYRWQVAPHSSHCVEELAQALSIPLLVARTLCNRGVVELSQCNAFLNPRLKDLAHPELIPNLDQAIERLIEAHLRKESVVIFGDYDVDGVTSTALLKEILTELGWTVACYLPHRIDEGYGLSAEAVENCISKLKPNLLVAVDCGTNSIQAAAFLQSRGVDLIVVDHHQLSTPVTSARALINPQADPGADRSCRDLCSVGLAFKLAHGILKRARALGWIGAETCDLRDTLDLVALGTIADLAPLQGDNRILVAAGLPRLTEARRPGVRALKQVAQVRSEIGVYEVGYQLAPRLNAAGRLESAVQALELLLAPNFEAALPLAAALDAQNLQRRALEQTIVNQALTALRANFDPARDFAIVAGESPWHVGVIGIVASRVLREFYRPTIIMGADGIHFKGSGRSIEGFDLAGALRQCDDLLVKHGGHAMAAGLSILPDRVDEFRSRLNNLVRDQLQPEAFFPPLRVEAEIKLADVTLDLIKHLERLEPMGHGNPPPQFAATALAVLGGIQRLGKERQHAKFNVTDGQNVREVLWFGSQEKPLPSGTFDLAFIPQINNFNGKQTLQLKLIDWRENVNPSRRSRSPVKTEEPV